MKSPRVFILYDDALFAHGLVRLLNQEGFGEVVGIATKDERALDQIESLKPDITLVEAEKDGGNLVGLLKHLVQEQGEAIVLSVSLNGNEAFLYTGRRFTINHIKDLVAAIGDSEAS